jgi:hypothetical protein
MWRAYAFLAVAALISVTGGAYGYTLQLVGFTGSAHVQAADNQGWSATVDDECNAIAVHPWYPGNMDALNFDLSGGGGAGAGTYLIGESTCSAASFNGTGPNGQWLDVYSQVSATATYTWTLLSDYGNTGIVTLTLNSQGSKLFSTPGGGGSASISISSAVDSYQAEPSITVDPDFYWYWDDSVSFNVPIGGTITVVCITSGGAYGGLGDSGAFGGGSALANLVVPVEVPDPGSLVLLASGSIFALRRRRAV